MRQDGEGFLRFTRLLENLPLESRFIRHTSPVAAWSWDDEVKSLILHELNQINTTLYNVNRKNGSQAAKVPPQFQPEYVKEAKEEYLEKENERKTAPEDLEATRAFWKSRHPDIEMM